MPQRRLCEPQLRVEAQVFLLVNDPYALNFQTMFYDNTVIDARHQAKNLPTHTGTTIVFAGFQPAQNIRLKMLTPSSHLERSSKMRKVRYGIFA